MQTDNINVPSIPEWEAYKMRRTNRETPISDYEYLMWPRLLDGRPYLEELKDIYIRLLETEPFWSAQPVADWTSLTELFLFDECLQRKDWEGAVITIDNVVKYSTDYTMSYQHPLNKGVMSKLKAVMREGFANVQFAGEAFPLYRG